MKKFAMFVLIGGAALVAPDAARACACGCGIFDVATSSIMPQDSGAMLFIDYGFQDQDRNWANTGPASSANNPDHQIRTDFTTYGLQYMFNRTWGAKVEVPYDFRDFKTLGGAGGIASLKWSSLGDIRVEAMYLGLSDDMSSGLTFGVKLPTGDFAHNDAYSDIDRDSELGTGSTDILLGGFHRHRLTADNSWTWFAQAQMDIPVLTQDQYRPGYELNTAFGVYYKGWLYKGVQLTPLAQAIATVRTSDSGNYAAGGIFDNPAGGKSSGYQRILLSPGVEFKINKVNVYADIELPVFQDFVGNQLAAPWLFKMYMSYTF